MTGDADEGSKDATDFGNLIGTGLVLGALGGLAAGAALDSLGFWLPAGVVIGLAVALGLKYGRQPTQT